MRLPQTLSTRLEFIICSVKKQIVEHVSSLLYRHTLKFPILDRNNTEEFHMTCLHWEGYRTLRHAVQEVCWLHNFYENTTMVTSNK